MAMCNRYPVPERLAVRTYVLKFGDAVIQEAITRETSSVAARCFPSITGGKHRRHRYRTTSAPTRFTLWPMVHQSSNWRALCASIAKVDTPLHDDYRIGIRHSFPPILLSSIGPIISAWRSSTNCVDGRPGSGSGLCHLLIPGERTLQVCPGNAQGYARVHRSWCRGYASGHA